VKGGKMKITLTIEEALADVLKMRALVTGKSFKQVVNETLLNGLRPQAARKVYRLKPASLGMPLACVNLDKALQLADENISEQ
jgi:hypothetical protein